MKKNKALSAKPYGRKDCIPIEIGQWQGIHTPVQTGTGGTSFYLHWNYIIPLPGTRSAYTITVYDRLTGEKVHEETVYNVCHHTCEGLPRGRTYKFIVNAKIESTFETRVPATAIRIPISDSLNSGEYSIEMIKGLPTEIKTWDGIEDVLQVGPSSNTFIVRWTPVNHSSKSYAEYTISVDISTNPQDAVKPIWRRTVIDEDFVVASELPKLLPGQEYHFNVQCIIKENTDGGALSNFHKKVICCPRKTILNDKTKGTSGKKIVAPKTVAKKRGKK